jgi:NAD(P)-dependent dehydrogenase (short-subunit alcohol dehydrogenase family)
MELKNRVIIVTGGGRGLGEAIVRSLSAAGATVVIADYRQELARKVASELDEGQRSMVLGVDVGDAAQVEEAIRQTEAELGGIDAIINNAGTDFTLSIEEMSVENWDRVMATNLRGPFLMSKYALPALERRGGGHIVNIASTAAKRCWANASAYHASKWGLLGFSHALHVEARPRGVKVTAVICGGMRTPFLLDRFPDIDVSCLQDPRNVADTVRFVLSQPDETVIPEIMVLPMRETSWP